jgi:membrane-bound lytic murein transglycosylase
MASDMEKMGGVARAQDGAREWLGMLQTLAEQIQKQQTLQQTAQQWMEQAQQQQQAFQQQAEQQQQAFQQMTQEVLNTYTQLFNIPLSYAQEGLRTAQFPIEGYDELAVEEISGRLGGLSTEELRMVRDYEERNKNRGTILEQLDRKIRSGP